MDNFRTFARSACDDDVVPVATEYFGSIIRRTVEGK